MVKAREDWAFQEIVSSAKENQAIIDYITRGQLVYSGMEVVGTVVGANVGFYPYNADKQLYNRLHVVAKFGGLASNGGPIFDPAVVLQYSINAGVAWVNAPAPVVAPPGTLLQNAAWDNAGAWTTMLPPTSGQWDIDISGAVGATYIGIGFEMSNPPAPIVTAIIGWNMTALFYNNIDTPF